MNLLLPGFLAAGLLAGLPILLHLLRKKAQRSIPFPSLRFLGPRVLRETKRHRILRWIVLAMRCALIALIVAAFARPFFSQKPNPHGRGVIVAVDNSFSMQAADRWPTLLQWARAQVADLQPGDQLGILLMNPTPSWLVPMTGEIDTARAALDALKPGWQTTRYRQALHLAGETLRGLPFEKRELVWMADEQRTGWREVIFSEQLPAGITVRFAPAQPVPKRQAAINSMRVRADGKGIAVELTIQQFAPTRDSRSITLFAEGKQVAQRTVDLESGKPTTITMRVENMSGALALKAEMDADDLHADDVAYATFNSEAGIAALLAPASPGEETDFIAHALEATRQQDLENVRRLPLPDGNWPPHGVAVLRGGAPFRGASVQKLTAFLQNGGTAWIMIDGDNDQLAWLKAQGIEATPRPTNEVLQLRDFDLEHPLFAPFAEGQLTSLLSLSFKSGWGIEGRALIPLARWTDQTNAITEMRIGNGQLLLTGFEPSRRVTSMPLTSAFVPFVHRAVTWLAQSGHETKELRVGETIPLPTGEETWSAIDSPEKMTPQKVAGAVTPQAPGLYQYAAGETKKMFAVNLSPDESDLAPYPDEQALAGLQSDQPADSMATAGVTFLPGEVAEQQSQVWWWLLLIAAVLLLGELTLSNRTAL